MRTVETINAIIMALFFLCYSYQFVYLAIGLFAKPKKTEAAAPHRRIAVLELLRQRDPSRRRNPVRHPDLGQPRRRELRRHVAIARTTRGKQRQGDQRGGEGPRRHAARGRVPAGVRGADGGYSPAARMYRVR